MADEDDEEMSESEEIAFGLISTAGTARSLYMNAMKAAREGKFDEADDLMKQARSPRSRRTTRRPSSWSPRPRATTFPWTCSWCTLRTT